MTTSSRQIAPAALFLQSWQLVPAGQHLGLDIVPLRQVRMANRVGKLTRAETASSGDKNVAKSSIAKAARADTDVAVNDRQDPIVKLRHKRKGEEKQCGKA